MAVYRCRACGYIFDEEKEGKSIRDIDVCPRCKQPDDMFVLVEDLAYRFSYRITCLGKDKSYKERDKYNSQLCEEIYNDTTDSDDQYVFDHAYDRSFIFLVSFFTVHRLIL